jgi:hypothetical protein
MGQAMQGPRWCGSSRGSLLFSNQCSDVVPLVLEPEYVVLVPTVWFRDDTLYRGRFHRSPDCRQLRKKPSRGEHSELIAVDLNEIDRRPCGTCYPDAPRIKIRKAYCQTCQSKMPCVHNGGVLITNRAGRRSWVWPDSNKMPLYRSS